MPDAFRASAAISHRWIPTSIISDALDSNLYYDDVPLSAISRDALLHHARRVIRQRLCNDCGEFPQPDDPALRQPAGSFVTIHELLSHRLRGCVGRLDASIALWESVRQSALSVLADPRFTHQPIGTTTSPNLPSKSASFLRCGRPRRTGSTFRPTASTLPFATAPDAFYRRSLTIPAGIASNCSNGCALKSFAFPQTPGVIPKPGSLPS